MRTEIKRHAQTCDCVSSFCAVNYNWGTYIWMRRGEYQWPCREIKRERVREWHRECVGAVPLAVLALSKHVWLGHIWERERFPVCRSAAYGVGIFSLQADWREYTFVYSRVLNIFDMKSHPEPFTNMNSVVLDDGLCFPVCNTRE